jgi:rfaE bifunctional protein kinase chain/domain
MKPGELEEIIKSIKSAKIAIVGDFCLDAYWFIDPSASEVSIETGQTTQPVRRQKYSLGGAGNVANNLAAMEVKDIRTFGVIGDDPYGNEMVTIMKKTGIKTNNLLIQKEDWSTHVYIKPYLDEREQGRIDFGNFNLLSAETADELIDRLKEEIHDVDLIIINQQVLSGIHTPYFRQKLVAIICLFQDKVFIADSRNFTDFYTGAFRKMNDIEAVSLCNIKKAPDELIPLTEVKDAAERLYKRYRKPIFITRGSRGSLAISEKGICEIPGMMIISRVDTVGAGDSYLAGVAAAVASGHPIDNAAEFGTFVAGVTVQKLFQTGTASPSEILQIGQNPDYIYFPEIAQDIRLARYIDETEIEIINRPAKDSKIKYAIFDNDGTLSTLREGWENVMAPMMVKAILGEKHLEADESLYHKIESRVNEFIDKSTGIQTLMQMKFLLELIREFGFVPEENILDEFGYKKIYNDELMQMVKQREKKYLSGELGIEDLTLKNAVPFVERLFNEGIKLYLTSGTDEEDAKHEASVLGYDRLFEGGIFGAVGDVTMEAKKIVLDLILNTIGESKKGMIATFGDGPVEIRETHKRGGITIGVASNEIKRWGLNKIKRTRLIKAGADIIIPDFSKAEQLLGLLNIK